MPEPHGGNLERSEACNGPAKLIGPTGPENPHAPRFRSASSMRTSATPVESFVEDSPVPPVATPSTPPTKQQFWRPPLRLRVTQRGVIDLAGRRSTLKTKSAQVECRRIAKQGSQALMHALEGKKGPSVTDSARTVEEIALVAIPVIIAITLHEAAHWVWNAGGNLVSPNGKQVIFNEPLAMQGWKNYLKPPDIR